MSHKINGHESSHQSQPERGKRPDPLFRRCDLALSDIYSAYTHSEVNARQNPPQRDNDELDDAASEYETIYAYSIDSEVDGRKQADNCSRSLRSPSSVASRLGYGASIPSTEQLNNRKSRRKQREDKAEEERSQHYPGPLPESSKSYSGKKQSPQFKSDLSPASDLSKHQHVQDYLYSLPDSLIQAKPSRSDNKQNSFADLPPKPQAGRSNHIIDQQLSDLAAALHVRSLDRDGRMDHPEPVYDVPSLKNKAYEGRDLQHLLMANALLPINAKVSPSNLKWLRTPLESCQTPSEVLTVIQKAMPILDSLFFFGLAENILEKIDIFSNKHHHGEALYDKHKGYLKINMVLSNSRSGTRAQQYIEVLLHEMVHMFFFAYTCTCDLCCQRSSYARVLGKSGHSPLFLNSLHRMQSVLRELCGWQVDCGIEKSVREEMRAGSWKPKPRELTRWGLEAMFDTPKQPLLRQHQSTGKRVHRNVTRGGTRTLSHRKTLRAAFTKKELSKTSHDMLCRVMWGVIAVQ